MKPVAGEARSSVKRAVGARPVEPAAAPVAPPAPEAAPKPAPVAAAPTPPPAPPGDEVAEVTARAQQLFAAILAGDARGVARQAAFPFHLEAQRLGNEDELFREWHRRQGAKRTDLLKLDRLEVLTPEAMEQRHGAPPARLASLPWKGPRTYLAVARLSGHAAVAIFHQDAEGWRLVGYHD